MAILSKLLSAFELEAGGAMLQEITRGMTNADVTKVLGEIYDKEQDKLTRPKKPRRRRKPRGYIWMTRHDSRVRAAHRVLHGRMFLWSSPPVAGKDGQRYHAGRREGCRCFPMRVEGAREIERDDWIDEARAALGLALRVEKSDADLADVGNVNRRKVFEALPVPQFGATSPKAARPARPKKRVVWGGE